MIIFVSQTPILGVAIIVLFLAILFEIIGTIIGLKTRHNITVLSAGALLCLGVALIPDVTSGLPAILYAAGLALGVILVLYALATARRGGQRAWFASLLIIAIVTAGAAAAIRATLEPQDAESAAALIYALTFVPAVSTLAYGLFAPDIPKLRGSTW